MILRKIFKHSRLGQSSSSLDLLPGILLFIGALVSILWSVYFARVTISIPYQIEFREGIAQVLTSLLLNGENPFVLENQPLGMNNYGLGYDLAVLPFAALFGNTLSVHRAVTYAFVLLSFLVSFWAVYATRRDPAPALACGAFVMIGLMARGGIGAFPSAMGSFLFLLAVLIVFARSFDNNGLVLSALFSLAAFYTKPYFVLAFAVVASYLFLFVSKKKGLSYSLLFLILFAILFLAVRFFLPMYFINTIVGNVSNTHRSFEHLRTQLVRLVFYFCPVLILSLVVFMGYFRKKETLNRVVSKVLNLSDWDQPLIGRSPDYFLYFFICTLLAFLFILGPHIGSYLNYAYQIVVPAFFWWLFQRLEFRKMTGVLFALLVLFNLFSWERSVLAPGMLEQGSSSKWDRLYSYLQPSLNILNSPVITSKVVDLGLAPQDSGQTIFFYSIEPFPDNELIGPSYDAVRDDGLDYIESIDASIQRQEFDLIFTTDAMDVFFDRDLLGEYYSLDKEIKVDMPQTDQEWTVFIWKPLGK